jgi:diguanylate cyclase (GGDEF)-like protein
MGDQMIRDAATVLHASLRDADVLARMGGDEFVAYAMDQGQPHALLSRLRRALDAFNQSRQRPFQLSLSVGMGPCDPSAGSSLNEHIQQAGRAMYEHKRRLQPGEG